MKCRKCFFKDLTGNDFRPGRRVCKKCESRLAGARRAAAGITVGLSEPTIVAEVRFPPDDLPRVKFPYAQEVLDRIYEEDVVKDQPGFGRDGGLPEIVVGEVEKLTHVEEHRLKVRNAELTRQVKSLTEQLSNAQMYADLARQAAEAAEAVEPIEIREHTSGLREGTVQVLCSDLHIEEEVKPEQVAGRNRYNLEISKNRCERLFQGTLDGIEMYRGSYKIRDLIFWLGGDLITGYLHDDNIENNLLSPVEAIAEMYSRLVGGFDYMLQKGDLERIIVPCNDGNHGRLTERTRSATRVENSIEWLLYKMVADHYEHDPRIEFILPQGAHTYFEVYGNTIHYHHGDEAKYGGGVGGILIPIRKAVDRWNSVRSARLHNFGHFHQRINVEDIIVNGSLIGYGPYSFTIGARFEPPVQDFSILDAKRWRGPSMPIWVADREDDEGV